MTSSAEAKSKFGHVVRDAGGTIFGVERGASVGSRQEERLQIGTPDGFIKVAVPLNQPNIDAVLGERADILVKHAEELRKSSRLIPPGPSRREARPEGVERRPDAFGLDASPNDGRGTWSLLYRSGPLRGAVYPDRRQRAVSNDEPPGPRR